jgi:hypothetical protein
MARNVFRDFLSFINWVSGGNAVVEQETLDLKFQGSNPNPDKTQKRHKYLLSKHLKF